eukprot:TRINITY_DN11876_c0_g2_i2.p1 TRINITY_DN11876_c0_g2~~TRINITY_DN11876_c0_g2_i2.p1  ORF type:complete len:346 (+),score=81.48 TRINITY_DN11876_c0_g2_i2:161-1198(+)
MGKKRGGYRSSGGFTNGNNSNPSVVGRGRGRGGRGRRYTNFKQGYHANDMNEEYDESTSYGQDSVVYGMESMRVNDMVYYQPQPPQPSFVEILDKYSILLGKTHRATLTHVDDTGLLFDLIVESSLSETTLQPSAVYSTYTPHPNSILDSMDTTTLTQIIGPPPYIVRVRMVWAEIPLFLWEDLPLKVKRENVCKGFPIGTFSKVFVYKICQTCAYPHHKSNSHLHLSGLPPHEHVPLVKFAKSPWVKFPPFKKGLLKEHGEFYSLADKKKKLSLSYTNFDTTATTPATPITPPTPTSTPTTSTSTSVTSSSSSITTEKENVSESSGINAEYGGRAMGFAGTTPS